MRHCPSAFASALLCTLSLCRAEIIPPDRRIDWSTAGIPGGIPERKVIFATIDAATFGDGKTDATAAIQKAIDECREKQVVFLPAGTYCVSKTINLRTGKTLRGAGMGKTIIQYTPAEERSVLDMRLQANWDIEGQKRSFAITGGMEKGSTEIKLGQRGPIAAGDVLLIDQLNDGKLVDVDGNEGKCTYCGRAKGTRARGQFAEVVAVNDTTIKLNLPLFWSLDPALEPQATLINAKSMVRWAGIEDLTVTEVKPAVDFMIEMDGAQYCWLRNVECNRIKRRAVWLIESLQNQISQCYFHDAIAGFGRDRGYGLCIDDYSTHNLVEDNIFHTVDGGSIMTCGGAAGNVLAYNYMFDSRFDDPWWLTQSPCLNHSPHPCMNLWEGNIGVQAGADFIHGSSSHNTMFRCRSAGWQNAAATSNNNAVEIQYKNTYYNVIGCVLGTEGKSAVYENAFPQPSNTDQKTIWRLGYGGPKGVGDENGSGAKATLLRHGNYDFVTKDTVWDPAIKDHALPPSLYLKEKPRFFGELPWPAIGPDVKGLCGALPAQVRYETMRAPKSDQ